MGIGFMLDWKLVFPIQSPLLSTSSARHYSSSLKGREASLESAKVSTLSVILEDSEICNRDSLKPYVYTFEAKENSDVLMAEMKMNIQEKGSHADSFGRINSNSMPIREDTSTCLLNDTTYFSFLMENLEKIEEIFDNSDLVQLERDILVQIGRLGALQLFHACLSMIINIPVTVNQNYPPTESSKDLKVPSPKKDCMYSITVCSGKKMERKSKRERASKMVTTMSTLSSSSKALHDAIQSQKITASRSRRKVIARNESTMSRGVKEVADLEKILSSLEEKLGQAVSFGTWADAAGINEKVLQHRLQFGWYCRDELIKSMRSLVLYLARNYRGKGIGLDDLLQAGNMGVLQGAERFDPTRGYQFSTYAQYWIRKSMSTLVSRHSRGIPIPMTLNDAINQTQKARRTLCNCHGRYPDDDEVSKFTGLSLAKIRMASKCLRVVGSIDQKVGHGTSIKFMEITPDTSVMTPEDTVMREHMRNEIHELLQGLHPRERQVLVLRYGIGDGKKKSLEEIGRLFRVTKEWIRKIEKVAFTKIRKEHVQNKLSHYLLL